MSARDRIAAVVATITLAVAAIALGSAPRWAACLTAGLCLATAAPLLRSRRYLDLRPLLLLFLAIAIGATIVQLVPIPSSVVAAVSPYRWNVEADNAAAWGTEPPSFLATSYDVPATLVELAKLTGYFAFAFTALWLATSSRGRRWLMTSVGVVGGTMAVIAVAHRLVGAKKLFGIYQPQFHPPPFLAPLLNPNHLAALLAVTVPVAMSLAASTFGPRRLGWIATALLCAGVTLLTESRAGAIALVMAAATVAVLLWVQHRRGLQTTEVRLPRNVVIPMLVVMACMLSLLVAFTAGGVAQELSRTTTEELTGSDYKIEAWRSSKALMHRHPWTGVGRGAFEFTFTRVHPSGTKTYSHVENEYLQTIIDWGVPAAAALGILLALMATAAARRCLIGPLEAGAIGGLVALGLHNFVDFNLEFPAVALPGIALVCVVLPGKLRESRSVGLRRVYRGAALAAGVCVLVLAASPLGAGAKEEAADLDAELDAAKAGKRTTDLLDEARDITARHPADYVAFGLAARVLLHRGDPRSVRLVNRALDLNGEHSGLHWLAAQMLAVTSAAPTQSLGEYALALRTADDPRPILADLLERFPRLEDAALALPSTPVLVENIAFQLSILKRDDVALAYVKRMHAQVSSSPEIAGLLADYALLRGEVETALAAAAKAYERDPNARNAVRWGRALSAVGRNDEAAKMLDEAIHTTRSRGTRKDLVSLLTIMGDVQRLQRRLVEAKETLGTALMLAASDRKALAAARRGLAQVEDAMGNPTVAAVHREYAERLDPTVLPPPDPEKLLELLRPLEDLLDKKSPKTPASGKTPPPTPTAPTATTTPAAP